MQQGCAAGHTQPAGAAQRGAAAIHTPQPGDAARPSASHLPIAPTPRARSKEARRAKLRDTAGGIKTTGKDKQVRPR